MARRVCPVRATRGLGGEGPPLGAGGLEGGVTKAAQVLGPEGALLAPDAPGGMDWQNRFLYAPAIRIAGGSNEVPRNIMGERVLGLPREPQVDRDVPFRDLPRRGAGP